LPIDEAHGKVDIRTGRRHLEMNRKNGFGIRWMARMAAFLAALWIPSSAFAQNCALCYTQAAGSGERIIQALRGGILILMIPPILMCAALTVMTYRRRNQFVEE
jgi:hypothetical protein